MFLVCKKSDIGEGKCRAFKVEGKSVAVYSFDGEIFATEDICRHRGGSLGKGKLNGRIITCPMHDWRFDIVDGKCLTDPKTKITTYPVKIEDDKIFVDL